jgi:hypothetical protein
MREEELRQRNLGGIDKVIWISRYKLAKVLQLGTGICITRC